MRISDWSSDVCSSDLAPPRPAIASTRRSARCAASRRVRIDGSRCPNFTSPAKAGVQLRAARCWAPAFTWEVREKWLRRGRLGEGEAKNASADRSEEHTSALQSLMRISYAVFCLKKKKTK